MLLFIVIINACVIVVVLVIVIVIVIVILLIIFVVAEDVLLGPELGVGEPHAVHLLEVLLRGGPPLVEQNGVDSGVVLGVLGATGVLQVVQIGLEVALAAVDAALFHCWRRFGLPAVVFRNNNKGFTGSEAPLDGHHGGLGDRTAQQGRAVLRGGGGLEIEGDDAIGAIDGNRGRGQLGDGVDFLGCKSRSFRRRGYERDFLARLYRLLLLLL